MAMLFTFHPVGCNNCYSMTFGDWQMAVDLKVMIAPVVPSSCSTTFKKHFCCCIPSMGLNPWMEAAKGSGAVVLHFTVFCCPLQASNKVEVDMEKAESLRVTRGDFFASLENDIKPVSRQHATWAIESRSTVNDAREQLPSGIRRAVMHRGLRYCILCCRKESRELLSACNSKALFYTFSSM